MGLQGLAGLAIPPQARGSVPLRMQTVQPFQIMRACVWFLCRRSLQAAGGRRGLPLRAGACAPGWLVSRWWGLRNFIWDQMLPVGWGSVLSPPFYPGCLLADSRPPQSLAGAQEWLSLQCQSKAGS